MVTRELSRTYLDELKDRVDFVGIVSTYLDIEDTGKVSCYMHDERTPSMHVYSNNVYCHGCGYSADVYQFIMDMNDGMTFLQAVAWLEGNADILPQVGRKKVVRKSRNKKRVPDSWINYWRTMLTDDRRGYLYKRGLSNATIDGLGLGWDATISAYSIPFYTGKPLKTPVDTVQFRSHPDSGVDWRYIGKQGYVHPSIINRHLINPVYVIIFFGTFDAILASQDGLPAISTNGATMFSRPDSAGVLWLTNLLKDVRNIIVVPDAVPSEFEPAQKLANYVGGTLRYFPRGGWGKDYTDYRMSGHTVEDFIGEVLKMKVVPIPDDAKLVMSEVFEGISAGSVRQAVGGFAKVLNMATNLSSAVTYLELYYIQKTATGKPHEFRAFKRSEWQDLLDELSECKGVREATNAIANRALVVQQRGGGF